MSKKVDVFRVAMPLPLTVSQFVIIAPALSVFSLVIEAATYPAIKLGEVAIPFKGETIYRPTVPEIGSWKVRFPENYLGLMRQDIILNHATVDRESGTMSGIIPFVLVNVLNGTDIPVSGFKLMNCWIKGRDPVDLKSDGSTEVFKWNAEIRYDAVVEFYQPWGRKGGQLQ